MINLLKKNEIISGYNRIVSSEDMKNICFGILSGKEGESHSIGTRNNETALIILSGHVKVTVDSKEYELKRKNVFDEKATALYVPIDSKFTVLFLQNSEVAVCQTEAKQKKEVQFVAQESVRVRDVGKDNFRRKVQDIIYENVDAESICVGETINPSGNWSSYPPHKHDENKGEEEVKMDEVYFFKIYPENGFGLQRVYSFDKELDEALVIENNTTVLIPKGYHPVVATPGYKLYYLWILVGEKRGVLFINTHPDYRWMLNDL